VNRLHELFHKHGQSLWLDNIRRGMLTGGELRGLIADGLRGMTSNPTIFEKAISSGAEYDEPIRRLLAAKKNVAQIFDALAIEDVQGAADQFRPLYDASEGADGFVSIEVAPQHARDTKTTLAEAHRLWKAVNRPNAMVKIPATVEGIPAIQQALTDGININITLIFAVDRYRDVLNAYRRALEARAMGGLSLKVASVASFFVSRIDSAVDKILQEKIQAATRPEEKDALLELLGKVAVANARVAYQTFLDFVANPAWNELRKLGARVQRPLWASTGTKNPHYPDLLYVDNLIGRDTVNTLPPATLEAFRDHGVVAETLTNQADEARGILEKLKTFKIDLRRVTDALEADGLKQFVESYDKLLAGLTAKKDQLHTASAKR
jgi:transaldolase